jgi:hypothetical protein
LAIAKPRICAKDGFGRTATSSGLSWRDSVLCLEREDDGRADPFGELEDLGVGVSSALAHQQGDWPATVDGLRGGWDRLLRDGRDVRASTKLGASVSFGRSRPPMSPGRGRTATPLFLDRGVAGLFDERREAGRRS